jgi:hypothetical protein
LEEKKKRQAEKKKKMMNKGDLRADILAAQEDASGLWFQQMHLKMFQDTVSGVVQHELLIAQRCETHAQQHVEAMPDITMHELKTRDLKEFKHQTTARWKKIRQQEYVRRQHQGVIDQIVIIAEALEVPMRETAAIYPQKYYRGRVARRLVIAMRAEGQLDIAAKKLQAVFRWKVTMELCRRRIKAFKRTRELLMVLKIQRTFRLRAAEQQSYKEFRKIQNMSKTELQEHELKLKKPGKKKAELKISRDYREAKVKAILDKTVHNTGNNANRRDMETRIARTMRRVFYCRKMNRFINRQIQTRRDRMVLAGLATYIQGVCRSYLKKRKAMFEALLNVVVQPIAGAFRASSKDVNYMLFKLRTSDGIFSESLGQATLRERVTDFCGFLSDCGVSLSVIRNAFPTKKKEFTKEWKKDKRRLKRPLYQRALALHSDKAERVKIITHETEQHVCEVLLSRCKNTRCETPWSCFHINGSVCRSRRVFRSKLIQYKFLLKCCKHLRRASWRNDLMEEWLMVNEFLSQCANERISCLDNIKDDKARKKMEAAEEKERHSQMMLANKTMFGGLLSDELIREVVHVSCGRSLGSEVPDKLQQRGSQLWFRWFHKRLICGTCLATGTLEDPIRKRDGSCQRCSAAPHHTTAKGEQSTLVKANLVREAKDLREPFDQLIVHCAWRYMVPMEHHSRAVRSHTCYNVAAHAAKPWIEALKRCGVTTVGELAQLRYTKSPFGLQTVIQRVKLPVGLGDVISRVLYMIDKQQRTRNSAAIAIEIINRVHGGLSERELAKKREALQKEIKYEAILLSKGGANDAEIVLKRIHAKFLGKKHDNDAPKVAHARPGSGTSGTNLKAGSLATEKTKGSQVSNHSQRRPAMNRAQLEKANGRMKAAERVTITNTKCDRIMSSMESGSLIVPFPKLKPMNWSPSRFGDILFNTKIDTLGELLVKEHPEIGQVGVRLAAVPGIVSTLQVPRTPVRCHASKAGGEDAQDDDDEEENRTEELSTASSGGHDTHTLSVSDHDIVTEILIARGSACDVRSGTMNPVENNTWGTGFSPMKSSRATHSAFSPHTHSASLSTNTSAGFEKRHPWSKKQHCYPEHSRRANHAPQPLVLPDSPSSDPGVVVAARREWIMKGEHGCSSPIQLRTATPSSCRSARAHNSYSDKLLSQVYYSREMRITSDPKYRPNTAPAVIDAVLGDGSESTTRSGRCGKSVFG